MGKLKAGEFLNATKLTDAGTGTRVAAKRPDKSVLVGDRVFVTEGHPAEEAIARRFLGAMGHHVGSARHAAPMQPMQAMAPMAALPAMAPLQAMAPLPTARVPSPARLPSPRLAAPTLPALPMMGGPTAFPTGLPQMPTLTAIGGPAAGPFGAAPSNIPRPF